MGLFNILALAVNAKPVTFGSAMSSLTYSFLAIAVFLLIQFFGARFYTSCKERYKHFSLFFFVVLATVSILSLILAFFLRSNEHRLFAGVVGGVFIWTSLGEISEHMGWYSSASRGAVLVFLLGTATWLILAVSGVPLPVLGFLAYPLLTWGSCSREPGSWPDGEPPPSPPPFSFW